MLCFFSSEIFAEQEWTLAKDAKGIVIYTRIPEGSEIKEFKAITEVEASLSSLVAVISDVNALPKWYKNSGETKVLKKVSDKKQVYYYEVLVPFPFRNRYMVQSVEFDQDPETKVVMVEISNVMNIPIEDRGRIRMPVAQGSWELTPLGNNKVRVEHQYLADPGGKIPKSIVNLLIVGGPYHSLKKLKKFVKEERYQNASFNWLKE